MQSTVRPGTGHLLLFSPPCPSTHHYYPEAGSWYAYAQPTSPAGVLGASNRLLGRKWGVDKTQRSDPCLVSVAHLGTSLCSLEPPLLYLLNGHRIGARVNLKPGGAHPTIKVIFSSLFVAVLGFKSELAHSRQAL